LIEAVEKVKARIGLRTQRQVTEALLKNIAQPVKSVPERIALPTLLGLEIIAPAEVRYCTAEDNFTRFYLTDGRKLLICRKLKFFSDLLEAAGFCRIHRSTLVNLSYVKRYHRGKGGSVFLDDETELIVAAARKPTLLERLAG
ncbi:MAG: LytTR family DNA-binding domain-containing protein, partial [Bacteroidota bacterium]